MNLPAQYHWLTLEGAPKMLVEALKLYGTLELPANRDSPVILGWAEETGLNRVYSHDSVPWCGLFMAVVAVRAGYVPAKDPLWALNWQKFGHPVSIPMLGDVLTFTRKGGGHVSMYVGEDETCYHCLGGNQSDAVTITRIPRTRLHSASRAPFRIGQPANVRVVKLKSTGAVSMKET